MEEITMSPSSNINESQMQESMPKEQDQVAVVAENSHDSTTVTVESAPEDGHQRGNTTSPPTRKVTFMDFVRYATVTESTLNAIGILAACAAGASQPLMTIVSETLCWPRSWQSR